MKLLVAFALGAAGMLAVDDSISTAIRFDWTISFSTILATVSIVTSILGAAWAMLSSLHKRLDTFDATLKEHAQALGKHDAVLATYEGRILSLVGDLQRVIGRMEAIQDQRRAHHS